MLDHRPVPRTKDGKTQPNAFAQGKNRSPGDGWEPHPSGQRQAHLAEAADQLRMQDPSLAWARAPRVPLSLGPGHPATAPTQPSGGVTHSAWFQGSGSTLELASRCGL